jgi:hypothetical protein
VCPSIAPCLWNLVEDESASKRPDLLLLSCLDSIYKLVEFKRPDQVITRDDQLHIVLVGRDHDPGNPRKQGVRREASFIRRAYQQSQSRIGLVTLGTF